MFNVTRTLDSSHGTRQSGEAGQRRVTSVTTPPSARGVGSRRKEASGAPSRNSSRRSKKNNSKLCLFMTSSWLCWLKDRKRIKVVTATTTLTWETQNHPLLSSTGVLTRRKRREAIKHQNTKTAENTRRRGKLPNWPTWS